MVRIGVVALIRLQLRTASYRACYAKLDPLAAAALRAKVADPTGFAGIDFEETGYGGFAELVAACRADCWVRDKAVLDRFFRQKAAPDSSWTNRTMNLKVFTNPESAAARDSQAGAAQPGVNQHHTTRLVCLVILHAL